MRRIALPLVLSSLIFACTDDGGAEATTVIPTTSTSGDGDGDPQETSEESGDGDPGDGDPGDGDPGDGDPGDGDGDPGDGDGDPGPYCGDGNVDPGEECDVGGETMFCDGDCTYAMCGDGYHNTLAEECDDGNTSSDDGCVGPCLIATCGDGFVYAGVEECDDENLTDTDACKNDCSNAICGDGVIWEDQETCDDQNMVDTDDCTNACQEAACGDGVIWEGVETCDDGNMDNTDMCPGSCEPATCGDGFVLDNVEECDDGNNVDDDACNNSCEFGILACQNGATMESISPGYDMVVCDDPNNLTCEQDIETLCPGGWGLCSYQQFVNRNDGWNYAVNGQNVVVAEIYCRNGSGAGHFTLGPYGNPGTLSTDIALNCGYGSSRPNSCPANYGCNELTVKALCCAPTNTCGDGQVQGPEEQCDDGNQDETDACLNSCTNRSPGC